MQAQSGVGDWFLGDTLVLKHLLLACLLIPLPCVLLPNLYTKSSPQIMKADGPDVCITTTRDKVPSIFIQTETLLRT